jgi:hypothetical protein
MFDFGNLIVDFLLFLKLGLLALIVLYGIFTFVVFVQVRTMNRIITQHLYSPTLLILAIAHMLAALFLFVFALIIL